MIDWLLPRKMDAGTHGRGDALASFWYGDVGAPTVSRMVVSDAVAMTYSGCWAATTLLAGTTGMLPFNLYKRLKRGREVLRDDDRNTLVHDQPNEDMTAAAFRMAQVNQQVNVGNCYSEVQRDRTGFPIATWPIHYTRVGVKRAKEEIRTKDDTIPAGALYYSVRNNDGPPTALPKGDVLHMPQVITADGIVGSSLIRAARETIALGITMEQAGAAWFASGGVPKIVVEHPSTWTQDSRDNFRKEWKEVYGGAEGAKVALLTNGALAKVLNVNNQDSQYNESRQNNIEEIARWYGVPQHMIGHLLRSTNNNIEWQSIEFVIYSLMRWLTLWEQEYNRKMLTDRERADGYYFKFNATALLRGDVKTRGEFYRMMVSLGVFSRNMVLELEDMNPVPGGDVFLVQGAQVALDEGGYPMPPAMAQEPSSSVTDDEQKKLTVMAQTLVHLNESVESRISSTAAETALAVATLAESVASLRAEFTASKTAPDNTAVLVAASRTLQDALNRMYRVEANEARRAVGKPKEFATRLESFFDDKHVMGFVDAVEATCQLLAALGVSVSASELAATQVAASKAQLIEASGCAPAEFANSIESCVSDWEKNRAARVADEILSPT